MQISYQTKKIHVFELEKYGEGRFRLLINVCRIAKLWQGDAPLTIFCFENNPLENLLCSLERSREQFVNEPQNRTR